MGNVIAENFENLLSSGLEEIKLVLLDSSGGEAPSEEV